VLRLSPVAAPSRLVSKNFASRDHSSRIRAHKVRARPGSTHRRVLSLSCPYPREVAPVSTHGARSERENSRTTRSSPVKRSLTCRRRGACRSMALRALVRAGAEKRTKGFASLPWSCNRPRHSHGTLRGGAHCFTREGQLLEMNGGGGTHAQQQQAGDDDILGEELGCRWRSVSTKWWVPPWLDAF
jgi:hypothetical protein